MDIHSEDRIIAGLGTDPDKSGAFLIPQLVKNLPAMRETWVGKIPWRTERLPTPVFWPGEFHELYSPWGRKELDMTERLSPPLSFQTRVCQITSKSPANPQTPGRSSREMLLSPQAAAAPQSCITANVFAVCLSPPVLQEPLWPCISSAGCHTTSAGSCTATSLTNSGLSE